MGTSLLVQHLQLVSESRAAYMQLYHPLQGLDARYAVAPPLALHDHLFVPPILLLHQVPALNLPDLIYIESSSNPQVSVSLQAEQFRVELLHEPVDLREYLSRPARGNKFVVFHHVYQHLLCDFLYQAGHILGHATASFGLQGVDLIEVLEEGFADVPVVFKQFLLCVLPQGLYHRRQCATLHLNLAQKPVDLRLKVLVLAGGDDVVWHRLTHLGAADCQSCGEGFKGEGLGGHELVAEDAMEVEGGEGEEGGLAGLAAGAVELGDDFPEDAVEVCLEEERGAQGIVHEHKNVCPPNTRAATGLTGGRALAGSEKGSRAPRNQPASTINNALPAPGHPPRLPQVLPRKHTPKSRPQTLLLPAQAILRQPFPPPLHPLRPDPGPPRPAPQFPGRESVDGADAEGGAAGGGISTVQQTEPNAGEHGAAVGAGHEGGMGSRNGHASLQFLSSRVSSSIEPYEQKASFCRFQITSESTYSFILLALQHRFIRLKLRLIRISSCPKNVSIRCRSSRSSPVVRALSSLSSFASSACTAGAGTSTRCCYIMLNSSSSSKSSASGARLTGTSGQGGRSSFLTCWRAGQLTWGTRVQAFS